MRGRSGSERLAFDTTHPHTRGNTGARGIETPGRASTCSCLGLSLVTTLRKLTRRDPILKYSLRKGLIFVVLIAESQYSCPVAEQSGSSLLAIVGRTFDTPHQAYAEGDGE